jgi:hypothetical protein
MNAAIASNPQLIIYLDPFKIMRIAKESVQLAELYFRQGQKRYIKTEQEKAAANSEQNMQSQIASVQEKAKSDSSLVDKQNLAKEKQILLQGAFDLLKAGIPISADLQPIMAGIIENISMPLMIENQQLQQGIQQMQQEMMAQEQEQMAQEQQEGGQMQEQPEMAQEQMQ